MMLNPLLIIEDTCDSFLPHVNYNSTFHESANLRAQYPRVLPTMRCLVLFVVATVACLGVTVEA